MARQSSKPRGHRIDRDTTSDRIPVKEGYVQIDAPGALAATLPVHFCHAVVWLGSDRARVVMFESQVFPGAPFEMDIELAPADSLTKRGTNRLHEALCLSVRGMRQVLLTGASEATAEFESHLAIWAPSIAKRVVGVQHEDEPTDGRLVALARWHFTDLPAASASLAHDNGVEFVESSSMAMAADS